MSLTGINASTSERPFFSTVSRPASAGEGSPPLHIVRVTFRRPTAPGMLALAKQFFPRLRFTHEAGIRRLNFLPSKVGCSATDRTAVSEGESAAFFGITSESTVTIRAVSTPQHAHLSINCCFFNLLFMPHSLTIMKTCYPPPPGRPCTAAPKVFVSPCQNLPKHT